jgi:hypothetical protein
VRYRCRPRVRRGRSPSVVHHPGFDLTHHYLSQLSSGELGWMRWAVYSVATGIVSFGLPSVPNPWGGVFLFVAAAVAWVWIAALSVRLTRQLS